MKGKNFEIKVADLLNHLGTDTISFEEVKTLLLPTLTENGICGDITLYAVNGESIFVKMENIEGEMGDICDICGESFVHQVKIAEYSAKFVFNPQELEWNSEEVVFPINPRSNTINMEEMLYQAILLQKPFVIKCPSCEAKVVDEDDEDSEF